MDRLSVHQQQMKKSPTSRQAIGNKKQKQQQQQMKVVYISNPTKIKIDATRFKGLVQELTGQHSDVADLSRFAEEEEEHAAATCESTQLCSNVTTDQVSGSTTDGDSGDHDPNNPYNIGMVGDITTPFETYFDDDVFTPFVLENLAAFIPSSSSSSYSWGR